MPRSLSRWPFWSLLVCLACATATPAHDPPSDVSELLQESHTIAEQAGHEVENKGERDLSLPQLLPRPGFQNVNVSMVWDPPGWQRAQNDADMEQLYRENLQIDMEPWRKQNLSMSSFRQLLARTKNLRTSQYISVLAIRDNVVWLPLGMDRPTASPGTCQRCHWRLKHMVTMLREAQSRHNLTYPNVVVVLNTWDDPECSAKAGFTKCPAPVLSPFKNNEDMDLLIPPMFNKWHYRDMPMFNFPWELKVPKAFMRTGLYRCVDKRFQVCARYWLAHQQYWGKRNDTLDVGIVTGYQLPKYGGDPANYDPRKPLSQRKPLPKADYVELGDHARWKYLINTDGTVASWRLAKIMHVNSPILKQWSNSIEWYYRSLQPGNHYLEFWKTSRDDIFQLVESLKGRDEELQKMTQNAQQFAFKHFTVLGKALYFRKVLQEYKSLFPDMDEFVKNLPHKGRIPLNKLIALTTASQAVKPSH